MALVNVPDGFEVIWASVLAVWRLKTLEEKLEGDSPIQILWSQYLAEWLVSHSRDRGRMGGADRQTQRRHNNLCRHFQISPLKVVTDFADASAAVGNLPRAMIPFRTGEKTPAPPENTQASKKSTPRVSEVDKDVEMSEFEEKSATRGNRSGKTRAKLVPEVVISQRATPTAKGSQRAPSTKTIGKGSVAAQKAGTKRDLPESPNKEEGSSKRSRKSAKVDSDFEDDESDDAEGVVAVPARKVDLGEETFLEDTPLDVARFPLARTLVRVLWGRVVDGD